MPAKKATDQLASLDAEPGPASEAGRLDEIELEIARLEALLRDSSAAEEEQASAPSPVANDKEMRSAASQASSDWLRQMCLLTELEEEVPSPREPQPRLTA